LSVAVGFSNGIGNLIIFSSIMKCLEKHFGEKLDFIYDSTRDDEVQLSVLKIASQLSSVKRVLDFCKAPGYRNVYMSRHNNYCHMYDRYVISSKENEFDWTISGISEIVFYYHEIRSLFGYKGPVFPQEAPMSKSFNVKDLCNYFCISNGYSRNGGNSMSRKSYPRWEEVVLLLNKMFPDYKIIAVGGKEDYKWGQTLPGITNLAGKLDILDSIALINGSKGVITTDTGIFHVADALFKPTVVLFGPTLTSKNGPINDTTVVIQSPGSCAPCQGKKGWFVCEAEKSLCMSYIKPSFVVSALLSILSKFA
jgi:ADP-heptose:LPS heptosyltransferase